METIVSLYVLHSWKDSYYTFGVVIILLGGQAKTLMFVHISPEPDAIGESISTLKFAERVATVELGAAKVNKDSTDVKELKEQVLTLSPVKFSSSNFKGLVHLLCSIKLSIFSSDCKSEGCIGKERGGTGAYSNFHIWKL